MFLPAQVREALIDWITSWLFQPWNTDASFRTGFIRGTVTALIAAYIVGVISAQLLRRWRQVVQFFGKSKAPPSAGEGPRPVTEFLGCAFALVQLILFLALLYWILGRL